MGFFGFLILVVAIIIRFGDKHIEKLTDGKIDLIEDGRYWVTYVAMFLGIVLLFNPFIHNDDGERTYVLDPYFGTETVFFDPGYHWGGFFNKSTSWPDVMSTVFDEENAVPIRFNDATQAQAMANVRWELPKDETSMIDLHKSYRSPNSLQTRTLEPYSRECLSFAAQLMELI